MKFLPPLTAHLTARPVELNKSEFGKIDQMSNDGRMELGVMHCNMQQMHKICVTLEFKCVLPCTFEIFNVPAECNMFKL